MEKIRRFMPEDGFGGAEKYIQVNPDKTVWLINKNGLIDKGYENHYPLSKCLDFVKSGDWIELETIEK